MWIGIEPDLSNFDFTKLLWAITIAFIAVGTYLFIWLLVDIIKLSRLPKEALIARLTSGAEQTQTLFLLAMRGGLIAVFIGSIPLYFITRNNLIFFILTTAIGLALGTVLVKYIISACGRTVEKFPEVEELTIVHLVIAEWESFSFYIGRLLRNMRWHLIYRPLDWLTTLLYVHIDGGKVFRISPGYDAWYTSLNYAFHDLHDGDLVTATSYIRIFDLFSVKSIEKGTGSHIPKRYLEPVEGHHDR